MFERLLCPGNGLPVLASELRHLMYRGSPIECVSSVFKYFGTTLADTDVRTMPMQIALANARKADGIVKSTAGSTVGLLVFRMVHLHQSRSSSLATVSAVAWAPTCYTSSEWTAGGVSFSPLRLGD